MIKIVHLIDGLTVGGAEMMLFKIVSNMDRSRFDNVVISLMDEGPIKAQILAAGIRVLSPGMKRGKPTPRTGIRLIQLLTEEKPDILQTWVYNADFAGILAARWLGLEKVIWNIRNTKMAPGEMSVVTKIAQMGGVFFSDLPVCVLSNSEAGKNDHIEMGYRARKWQVIPNGFDAAKFRPDPAARSAVRAELGIPDDAFLIGILGRYHPMKDHRTFLEAAMKLQRSYPNAHFVMAGSDLTPENEEIGKILAEAGDAKSFHLLGARKDVPKILAALDLFTLSSSGGEGFPNVVGEAMSCEVPCVVTATAGDAPSIVGECGVVVPGRDPEAMYRAWLSLITGGRENLRRLGSAARARVLSNFTIDAIVKEYEALYQRVQGE